MSTEPAALHCGRSDMRDLRTAAHFVQHGSPGNMRPCKKSSPISRLKGPGHGMTTLDQCLYAWLCEPDERRFVSAFNTYYSLAYPALIRRLARLSKWDLSWLEEIAQDALLKFFERVGRGRRHASDTIRESLDFIRPLELGPMHQRQVGDWRSDVSSFREAAMSFQPAPDEVTDDAQWKATLRTLTDRIAPLQHRGWRLIDFLRQGLHWQFPDESAGRIDSDPPEFHLAQLAALAVAEVARKTAQALNAEACYPGASLLLERAFTVTGAIPQLRVPTNGYLFEIAHTLYIDECKKQGRLKRGGTMQAATADAPSVAAGAADSAHPLEILSAGADSDAADSSLEDCAPRSNLTVSSGDETLCDPISQLEGEDLFEKFYDYLRAPIDQAAGILAHAQGKAIAAAERRAASLTRKFSTTMSVLSLIGEGYTQEQSAEQLGLSRNQVKYIIETVQQAYAEFTAQSVRAARPSPTQAQSYAP